MEDQDTTAQDSFPEDTSQKPTPYDLLLRQSRKMGHAATKTYDVTREFLKKDVKTFTSKNPDSLLFGKKLLVTKKDDKTHPDIGKIVRQSHEILAAAKTVVLPINLFPDSIVVDRTKVTITKRSFFWTSQVITTRIEDILAVTANMGPFFASLTISTRIMNSTDHYEINFFWRNDAIYIKKIIQGYVIAQHNEIETKHLSQQEMIDTLLELGSDSEF